MSDMHPIVSELVAQLSEALREAFEERAAILEFDAGHHRDLAECLALLGVLRSHSLIQKTEENHVSVMKESAFKTPST